MTALDSLAHEIRHAIDSLDAPCDTIELEVWHDEVCDVYPDLETFIVR